jgi:hypothetical protein
MDGFLTTRRKEMTQKDYTRFVTALNWAFELFDWTREEPSRKKPFNHLFTTALSLIWDLLNEVLRHPEMLGHEKWVEFVISFRERIGLPKNVIAHGEAKIGKTIGVYWAAEVGRIIEVHWASDNRQILWSLLKEFCEPLIERTTEKPEEVQDAARV